MSSPTSAQRRPQRIGVLSFAHYHANFWSEVFTARGALAGIWDDDATRGQEAAARFGVEHHQDLESLLGHCTAVAICSETSRHPELIERAAQNGLAILCEKPLAVSLAEGERIARCLKAHRVAFMQSFPKRFDPVSQYLASLVESEALGRITLVRIRHGHAYGLDPAFRHRWYVQPELAGGGALIDEGIHGADLLAWLFGLPQTVTAVTSDAALGLAVEDLAVAVFQFASGLVAELTASFTFAAADTSIELYGTRGTVLVSGVDLASRDITASGFVRVFRTDSDSEAAPSPTAATHASPTPQAPTAPSRHWETVPLTPRFKLGEFHQQNALAFIDSLERGVAPPITIDDGLRALRMVDAAYRAARMGVRQDLSA